VAAGIALNLKLIIPKPKTPFKVEYEQIYLNSNILS
jgi:hypothetical protein